MCRLWRPGEGTAPVPHAWRHRGPCRHCGVARAPAKKSRSLRLEVMAAAAPRSVGIAPCDHEGRDHHRILPARRQRRRPLRGAGGTAPRRRRPPATCHRADGRGPTRPPRAGQDSGPFPYPVVRVPAVPLPGYPSFRLGLPSREIRARAAQAPDRGRAPGQPGHPRRVRRGPGRRWACPRSPCSRPTCRPTRTPTGSAGPARRSRGGGCGASTTMPPGRWRRPRSPRPACSAAASATCGCGAAAWTPPASTRPGAARRSGPSWRRAAS